MPWFRRIHDRVVVEVVMQGSMIWVRAKGYAVDLPTLEGNYKPYTSEAARFVDDLKAPPAQKIKGPKDG